jgi:hypothetical protein
MDANLFSGGPYGRDKAMEVKQALEAAGHLKLVQRPRQGSSAVYKVNKLIAPKALRFQEHDKTPVLEVRATKPDIYLRHGRPKGKKLKLNSFDRAEYEDLKAEMEQIVQAMGEHPLQAHDGTEWSRCTRIFNDGRFDRGGRVYGGWQSRKKEERRDFRIDQEPVCEIDIKASFLFLASRLMGHKRPLSTDPYKDIPFVQRDIELRGLAKILVSSLLSKPERPQQFPKSDLKDDNGNTIPLKKYYKIPKREGVSCYIDDILKAYPFLKDLQGHAGQLMFLESQLIVKTMLRLLDQPTPIVAYPVHDCLICKESDKEIVVKILREVFLDQLGAEPSLEVKFSDSCRKDETILPSQHLQEDSPWLDWFSQDEVELIEDD